VRRLGLFAGFLLLLGLTTAVAASFDVQAEDITSFSTPVEIEPPPPPGLLRTYWLRGDSNELPGILDPDPVGQDPVRGTRINAGSSTVKAQTNPSRYHNWQTAPAPVGGLTIAGQVTFRTYLNGGTGPVTVGLFSCSPVATPDSTDCHQIGTDATSGAGVGEDSTVSANLGIQNYTVPQGNRLRVQVVILQGGSSANVQWGYKSNRPSRLEITVPTP
jgi:hypothetical protein